MPGLNLRLVLLDILCHFYEKLELFKNCGIICQINGIFENSNFIVHKNKKLVAPRIFES